ncbi:MAG: replicative helicase loader/inhibitor [Eubacteriales bacterium]|nr:replicative helicase loader/inhibitor [Eubacteriales bacterium]
MRLEETQALLDILKKAYPSAAAYKLTTKEEIKETIVFYHGFFGVYETPIVVAALRNYIKKNQYPPTIAGLQEQIDLLLNTEDTDSELWNQLSKACKNGLYGSDEEYNKLPPECQRWLGSPNTLRELAMVDTDTFNTVVRGQFLKTIGQIKSSEQVQKTLSPEVRKVIESSIYKQLPFSD